MEEQIDRAKFSALNANRLAIMARRVLTLMGGGYSRAVAEAKVANKHGLGLPEQAALAKELDRRLKR